jgi:hypothetical protein
MKLAVTPLLIVIGAALLIHFNVAFAVDFESCLSAADYRAELQTYWDILKNEIFFSSHPFRIVLPVLAFLPFVIAALFIRSRRKLICQWVALGVVMALMLLTNLGTYNEPDWCLQPDAGDFGLGLLLGTYFTLVCLSLPIFVFATMIGLSEPGKDT